MADPVSEPADAALLRLISGYRVTQVLYVATKLGIPDLLSAGPKDAGTLASHAGVEPDRLHRVLRVMASLGVLTLDDQERFGLTPIGELLRTDHVGSMAVVSTFAGEEPYRAWGDLLHTVKTGETAFDHVYGMGHFEYLALHPEASAMFNRLMAWSVELTGPALEGYDLSGHRLLVDVGGGKGAMIASVLRTHPHLRGILFDQPAAVVDAVAQLSSAGVADRCEIRTGSAFDGVPTGGDVYVLSRVLHDWPDAKAATMLLNCRKAMAKGDVLLLVEGVMPAGVAPPSRLWLDLVMMVMNGGGERTEAEWRTLLEATGFSLVSVRPTTRPTQDLLEARAV